MKSIAVFCGSSNDADPLYIEQARQMGRLLAQRHKRLIYGGATIGLMGILADSVLEAGGKVIGVMPEFLKDKEIAHESLNDMVMVDNMHERKVKMHELADAFITLPGGFGTLEEFFETLTWGQLGLHRKPMGLLNVNGYFNQLFAFIDRINRERFIKTKHRDMILTADDPLELLRVMEAYEAPSTEKLLDISRT